MKYPAPDDLPSAPLWENSVIAQAVQATLGIVPPHALAVGVTARGTDVVLRFQLSALDDVDREEIADIRDDLEDLVGPSAERVIRSIQAGIDGVRGRLPEFDRQNAQRHLDHGELEVALDTLCSQLYEYDVAVPRSAYEHLRAAGETMGLDSALWADLTVDG